MSRPLTRSLYVFLHACRQNAAGQETHGSLSARAKPHRLKPVIKILTPPPPPPLSLSKCFNCPFPTKKNWSHAFQSTGHVTPLFKRGGSPFRQMWSQNSGTGKATMQESHGKNAVSISTQPPTGASTIERVYFPFRVHFCSAYSENGVKFGSNQFFRKRINFLKGKGNACWDGKDKATHESTALSPREGPEHSR